MSVNFLEKYISPATRAPQPHARAESDPTLTPIDDVGGELGEDHGCFGYLRGVKERAVMLELHKRTGNIRAIPYTWIESIDYDPSDGITLRCSVAVIHIKGRNLSEPGPTGVSLFGTLCRQRVPWLREVGTAELLGPGSTTLIEQIEW